MNTSAWISGGNINWDEHAASGITLLLVRRIEQTVERIHLIHTSCIHPEPPETPRTTLPTTCICPAIVIPAKAVPAVTLTFQPRHMLRSPYPGPVPGEPDRHV